MLIDPCQNLFPRASPEQWPICGRPHFQQCVLRRPLYTGRGSKPSIFSRIFSTESVLAYCLKQKFDHFQSGLHCTGFSFVSKHPLFHLVLRLRTVATHTEPYTDIAYINTHIDLGLGLLNGLLPRTHKVSENR